MKQKGSHRQPRRQKNFQVFLRDDEWERFLEVYERAKSRFDYPGIVLKKSFVIRRLVGLEPPDDLVTVQDINYFLGRQSSSSDIRQITVRLPPTGTDLVESDLETHDDDEQLKKIIG